MMALAVGWSEYLLQVWWRVIGYVTLCHSATGMDCPGAGWRIFRRCRLDACAQLITGLIRESYKLLPTFLLKRMPLGSCLLMVSAYPQ